MRSLQRRLPPAASPPAYRTWAVRELTAFLEAAVPRLDEIEKKRRSGERLTREDWEIQNLARSACDDADRLADSRGGGRRPGPPCWSPASPAPASGFLRDALERIRAADANLAQLRRVRESRERVFAWASDRDRMAALASSVTWAADISGFWL